jgi:hypothetical protein
MSTASTVPTDRLWLVSRKFDLTFLIGSAVLAAIPLTMLYGFHVSTTAINLLVAGLVGGPHLYSTFGYTLADGAYRKRFGWALLPCVLIPIGVVWLALNNLVLLLTIFFFWASVHVLHQIAYLTDAYRFKDPRARSLFNRAIDYGLIFTGLYVNSAGRLVRGEFVVGGGTSPRSLLIPSFAQNAEWIPVMTAVLFGTFLVLYIVKTIKEAREGRLNLPSVALISVTTVMSLIIPTFKNIDIAFQGYNTWHSFQYLALVWYINKLRLEHGEIQGPVMRTVSAAQSPLKFYGLFFLATVVAFGTSLVLQFGFGWPRDAAYYSVVLGTLLVHYYLDTINFTRWGLVVRDPSAAELGRGIVNVPEAAVA